MSNDENEPLVVEEGPVLPITDDWFGVLADDYRAIMGFSPDEAIPRLREAVRNALGEATVFVLVGPGNPAWRRPYDGIGVFATLEDAKRAVAVEWYDDEDGTHTLRGEWHILERRIGAINDSV